VPYYGLLDCWIAGLPDCQIAGLPDCQIAQIASRASWPA